MPHTSLVLINDNRPHYMKLSSYIREKIAGAIVIRVTHNKTAAELNIFLFTVYITVSRNFTHVNDVSKPHSDYF